MGRYILSLDQGTTSSRAIVFDKGGNIISMSQKEFGQIYPKPYWVEHDPMEILSSQLKVAKDALSKKNIPAEDIISIGITNQRETTVVWEKDTGKPIYNAICWQCHRTADMIEDLLDDEKKDLIKRKSGLIPDAYFSASKLAWILDRKDSDRKRAKKGELLFGTVDSWLIWNLTKNHYTDMTNASRTMLFNIHDMKWDEEILDIFNIPTEMLPKVFPSGAFYGECDERFFGKKIPITGVAGDQQAALFGQMCFGKGDVKNTYGTGCFLLMNTQDEIIESKNGLLTTVASTLEGEKTQYALEGSVFIGGACVQWLRDELRIIDRACDTEDICEKNNKQSQVYLVPSFTGMGAPYWNPNAKGMLTGIGRNTGREDIIKAAVDSICYQVADVAGAMEEDAKTKLTSLKVDGGASANNYLLKFQADILGKKVIRPSCVESTALGAAYLSGLYTGFWKDRDEIRENASVDRVFEPKIDKEKRDKLTGGWKKAVKAALYLADLE